MLANLTTGWATTLNEESFHAIAWIISHRDSLVDDAGEGGRTRKASEDLEDENSALTSEDILSSALSILASVLKEKRDLVNISGYGASFGSDASGISPTCADNSKCIKRCRCAEATWLSVLLARIYRHYDAADEVKVSHECTHSRH